MEIVLLIYLIGIIPAYLCLRHSFIRLSQFEGLTASDDILMVTCSVFSWITVVVSSTMMSLLFIEEIDQNPPPGTYHLRVRRN
jgi:hypothetical protein